ncbi:universal stress protein [Halobacterium wangiae]|uniref:universal stress protein n=1 Tax=Halobacterium wangiae TaxID=2902623 RepID=UPI001E2BB2DA|nr:universal stress protein [Halobacterium wangiae]
MPRNVLVPTDGSPLSKEAFEHAIDTFPDGHFTLIHVTGLRYIVLNDDNLNPEEKLTELVDLAERHDIEVETEIRAGRPSREIVTYSEENDIDEIVMGSHGREREPHGS